MASGEDEDIEAPMLEQRKERPRSRGSTASAISRLLLLGEIGGSPPKCGWRKDAPLDAEISSQQTRPSSGQADSWEACA